MKNQLTELSIPTRDGQFTAHYSDKGLAELDFPNGGAERPLGQDAQFTPKAFRAGRVPAGIPDKILDWHRATETALKNTLAGHTPKTFPPLAPRGTEFQKSVWKALRKIALGRTKSYGEIAQAIGKPRAVRAVGGACGANPIPVLVPCHRVLAANKKIGGFSGGLNWKRTLLSREGINL